MKHLFVLLATLAAPLPAARADTITMLDGKILSSVKIESETYAKIRFRESSGEGKRGTVPSGDVKSVDYDETPTQYKEARNLRDYGNLGEAASLWVAVAESKDDELKPFLRASALAEAADALLAVNNLEEALNLYDQLLKEFPDTRHLARAWLGKGRAALYAGGLDRARGAFEQLVEDAASSGWGEHWSLRAEYDLWRTRQALGRMSVQDLRAGYEDLRQRAGEDYLGVSHACTLQIGRLVLARGDAQGAARLFNEVIDDRLSAEREVAAGAYAGRGQCFFSMANAQRQKGELEAAALDYVDARLDFLRVVVSYPDVTMAQPEALYMAGQCFLNLADAHAAQHATSLFKRCRDRFPGSSWAQKAAQR